MTHNQDDLERDAIRANLLARYPDMARWPAEALADHVACELIARRKREEKEDA